MSQPQQRPAKKPTTRSRTGCWTCRARRKKCDEKRPSCTPCERRSIQCGGYSPRLKWGNGVASRGHLMGSAIPVHHKDGTSSNSAKPGEHVFSIVDGGEKRGQSSAKQSSSSSNTKKRAGQSRQPISPDSLNSTSPEIQIVNFATPPKQSIHGDAVSNTPLQFFAKQHVNTAIPLNSFEEALFGEFKEWGSQILLSGIGTSPFGEIISACAESKSLVANCLAFQITLEEEEHGDKFDQFYTRAIELFRADVCDPNNATKDATLIAGVILCSIGINRCMNWTIHLDGLCSILKHRNATNSPPHNHISAEVVDTVGFFDLPTHTLGRKSKPLHIWRDHCRGKSGIESNSNIPYSLIDLLSAIAEPGVELQCWNWTWDGRVDDNGNARHQPQQQQQQQQQQHPNGPITAQSTPANNNQAFGSATPLQRLAWDATRLAGIISAREYKQQQLIHSHHSTSNPNPNPNSFLLPPDLPPDNCPPTPLLLETILTTLKTILHYPETEKGQAIEIINILLYPAFMAGTQHVFLSPHQKGVIETFWREFFLQDDGEGGEDGGQSATGVALDILRDLWKDGRGRSAGQVARDRGVEVGLF